MSAGVAKTFTTSVPGQNAKWTFTGTSGQRLSFNFTSVSMASVRVTVKTPSGGTLFSNTFGTDGNFIEPLTLSATGTYTVTVDPQGASTGNVTMTYYVVAADRTFTVSTTVPADPCCVDSIELKVFSGSTQIGGSEFAGPSGYTFSRNLAAGTYTIVVDPFGSSTGTVTVTVS
jgi:hypothetical protein